MDASGDWDKKAVRPVTGQYRDYQDASGKSLQWWSIDDPVRWVAAIQECGNGYEATLKAVDLQGRVNLMRNVSERGFAPVETAEDNERRSRNRAKQMVRYKCKAICADHLLTLTTREDECTHEQMLTRFRKFVQMYRRAVSQPWEYVAVVESHPTNPKHLHIHVACAGRVKVDLARKIWTSILGGPGSGNIDAKHHRIADKGRSKDFVSRRIAAYIAKYVSKETVVAFNRKRYWSSRIELPELRRYMLDAETFEQALDEFAMRFGLDTVALGNSPHVFMFPGARGFWLEFHPELLAPDPF